LKPQGLLHDRGPFDVPGVALQRAVRVYEPVRSGPRDRPLVVLFDGQNVFDDGGSFAGGWHAHHAVERLAKTVSVPVIVGINHGHEQRISELSPFSFGRVEGKLDSFLDWVVGSLLPSLRRDHHLGEDPRRVTIGGSSMGGIAALYAALRHPDVFGGAIAMSPSLFIARGAIFGWVRRRGVPRGLRIYLDAGAREANGKLLEAATKMADLLRSMGADPILFVSDPKGQHSESCWRRRLLPALRFHYGTSKRSTP
jgi:enterochelin esterase-like enzyme